MRFAAVNMHVLEKGKKSLAEIASRPRPPVLIAVKKLPLENRADDRLTP
jgi:hypothetical protein